VPIIPPAEAPAASTVRLGLLIAAVLAAGTAIFIAVHGYLPSRGESLSDQLTRCVAELESDPAWVTPTPDRRDQVQAALAGYRACLRPALGDMAVTVAMGHGLLFGLAGVSYLTHPWWIMRRRGLKRLSAAGSAKLVAELDRMSREMGLVRSPAWWIAPYHRTSGGQAFGVVRRRHVQLDAGLLVRFVTDRPAFRAVVLHELAHLRNRDVDKTYLTIGIWRAFLAVAVLPLALLLVHPLLFQTPLDWRWTATIAAADPGLWSYRIGTLLVLAGLVYLTRNAVLRARESHADVVAAAVDGSGSAMPAVLERLPASRGRWARWGTHPDPARRLDAVRDPRLLLSTGPWELAGAGFAMGLLAINLTLMLGMVAGFEHFLGVAMVGLVAGAGLAVVLAVSIWRVTAAGQSAGTWLILPVALAAGFLAGHLLSLDTWPTVTPGPSWAVSALLLCAGAVLMAAWLVSVTRAVLATPRRRRRTMPAVVAAAVAAGATAFAVWLPASRGMGVQGSDPPTAGAEIGWYVWLVASTGWQLEPAAYLVYLPLTLPAVALLWLVPVLVGVRLPVRRAIIPALIGGGCAVAIGAVLPFLAKATLPASVRRLPDPDALRGSVPVVIAGVTSFTGKLAVVVVMAVVVARSGRQWPASAVLAGTVTAMVAAVGAYHVAVPMQCFANVFDLDPAPAGCLVPVDPRLLAENVNAILVQGMIVAIPIVLGVAAVGALVRRGRPGMDVPVAPLTGSARTATVVAVGLLVVLIGALTWGILPASEEIWLKPTFG
jgi:Zn-dependent protease with chaperone function